MPAILHILIVDDDADDREIFCEAVAEIDNTIECVEAKSGEDALKLLDEGKMIPDYIFLDLNMPRMDGRQCLKAIKLFPFLENIPVIIYTTSKVKDDIEDTKKLGASHFISKPNKVSEIKEAIRQVVQHNGVHTAN